ncbi:AAA family ATPase [Microbaculum marinum]|uniref:AAA family ATPase n=1 Tax=Microbaculum marinum TaxID=1764581 RepID=A0AAW9RY15_9HYPH
MLRSIIINNFRCYRHLSISHCSRFNLIVGDNAAGKTALLEALFLTLSGNVEISIRLRAHRGYDATLGGSFKVIEEALWRDYFFQNDWDRPVNIKLEGLGTENRSLNIHRGEESVFISTSGNSDFKDEAAQSPIVFSWTDSFGKTTDVQPKITQKGVEITSSVESRVDAHLFPANQSISATETASKFSHLSREGEEGPFVEIFAKEFPIISGLSVEVLGGLPVVHATMAGSKRKRPINSISGGINRSLAIMLTLATQRQSIVLVDEVENGIYHSHKVPVWRAMADLARENDSQMFITTHDEEWLKAIVSSGDDILDDVSIWRLEQDTGGNRVLKQFSGEALKANLGFGGDIR